MYLLTFFVLPETSIEEIRLPPETRYGKRTTPRPQAAQNGWIKSPIPEPNRPKKYDDEVVDDDDWESGRDM